MQARLLLTLAAAFALAQSAWAVDGQILINQSVVMAAGGFPYKITQTGSYKLSGNLAVSTNVDAIDIQANNVTLDLNGFTISSNSIAGIGVLSVQSGITIRNGAVVGFNIGVGLGGNGNIVEEIKASGGSMGLSLSNAVVRRNNVSIQGDVGIFCVQCVITENFVSNSPGLGLDMTMSVYGSNDILAGTPAVTFAGGGPNVSQGNNSCNGLAC
jgi:hypothetical protein